MASKNGLKGNIPPAGTKVQLTGIFLKNTGQQAGGEGSKKWLLVECPCAACKSGEFVAVNEPHLCQSDPCGYEDIPPEKRPKWRHFHAANLQVVGKIPKVADLPLRRFSLWLRLHPPQLRHLEFRGGFGTVDLPELAQLAPRSLVTGPLPLVVRHQIPVCMVM